MKYTADRQPILHIEHNNLNISNPKDELLDELGIGLYESELPLVEAVEETTEIAESEDV